MNVVVVARDRARRQTLIQHAEGAGWTVRADVPTEAALSREDLDGVAAIVIDVRDMPLLSNGVRAERDLREPLTARELDVLEQMAAGLSNRHIAQVLGISEHTVKFHVSAILAKLGVSSRSAAIRHGMRHGLVTL